ncbi:MAG: ISKra4 family transposase [Chloroflexi bacterium]|nr:ISKra4 family transposase [Chloroflexota bacterium]
MDSMDLSEDSIHEVGVLFEAALRAVAAELSTDDLAGLERRLQAVGRVVLGQVVERVLAGRAAHEGGEGLPCPHCGGPMRRVDRARARHIQGVVGDYTIRRAYDLCDVCRRGQAPLDVRIGLGPGTVSPSLLRAVCRLGIETSFAEAMDAVRETLGVSVADETARRDTDGIGAVAEADQQADVDAARQGRPIAATAPIATGVLAVAVDGVQAPHRDGWHEMKVGTLAPLGPGLRVDAETGRTHLAWGEASYCAGGEEAEAFWWRVYAEACRRGLGTPAVRTVVMLGDGAEWIWHRARLFLGVRGVEVVEIVDIYHVYEYLWEVGNAVFGAGSARAAGWVQPLKDRLYEQGAAPVLAALHALTPDTDAAVVRVALGYVTTQAARLDYPRFVARSLPIGSGAVESTCKVLSAARAKGAGMRWNRPGLQAIASLRALQRSGRWDRFWQTHPQRRAPYRQALPRPRPAEDPVAISPPQAPPTPVGATPSVAPLEMTPCPRPTPLRHQRPFLPPRARSA